MVYLILVIVLISIMDIKDLISKKKKKDLWVYVILMVLVGAFGIFYYSDQERDSISKILLSLIGRAG